MDKGKDYIMYKITENITIQNIKRYCELDYEMTIKMRGFFFDSHWWCFG